MIKVRQWDVLKEYGWMENIYSIQHINIYYFIDVKKHVKDDGNAYVSWNRFCNQTDSLECTHIHSTYIHKNINKKMNIKIAKKTYVSLQSVNLFPHIYIVLER